MAIRCYVAPADDPNGHGGQQWCTDDAGNFWPRRDSDPPVGTAPPAQPGSGTPTPTPGTATNTPITTNPGGGVGAAEANYALQLWLEAQRAKEAADRLNLLDIPKFQKDAAIAEADLKIRQAAESRAALNDEQKRQLDAKTAALDASKVSGFLPQTGPRAGDLVAQAWTKATAEGRATPETAAQIWNTAAGANPQQASAMARWGHDYNATFGHPPSNDEIDQKLQSLGLNPQAPTLDREKEQEFRRQFDVNASGYIDGKATLDREKEQNSALLSALQLRSQLQGPENAFKYASTFANLPDQIRGVIDAAAGRIGVQGLRAPESTALPGGGTRADGGLHYQTEQGRYGTPIGGQNADVMPNAALNGAGAYGVRAPQAGAPVLRAAGEPGVVGGSTTDPNTGLTRANQLDPQAYQRANPYAQKMTWAAYGAAGADPDAEKAKYLNSLTKYSGPYRGRMAA